MTERISYNSADHNRSGIVLLITLVLLIVIATLGYTLTSRVAAQRHRDQYIIDYSKARYGCESAVKYALATLEEIDPNLISRPNEPDFSDLFALDEVGYQEFLKAWELQARIEGKLDVDKSDSENKDQSESGETEPLRIRGPYGPVWPLITEPAEFEIGSAKVRIEIEDENAKYPLGWVLLDDKEIEREVETSFYIFCEWMRLDSEQIDNLRNDLMLISEIRPFKMDFKQITKTVRMPIKTPTKGVKSNIKTTTRTRIQRKTIPVSQQVSEQTSHFAKMFHSSLIDTEALARPTIVTRDRQESALKYMGIWGSRTVNINSAPRQVLESVFVFGGDEVEIADKIIQLRRQKPFANLDELKKELSSYLDSISKCENFITTVSNIFTIRITAISGVAEASSIIAITKEGNEVEKIAVIKD
jgi:hypothetical protein